MRGTSKTRWLFFLISEAFKEEKDVRGFLEILCEDAIEDIKSFGEKKSFVPTIVDVQKSAKGLYGVNAYRFFFSLAKFLSKGDKNNEDEIKKYLTDKGTNEKYGSSQAHILNIFSDFLGVVSRDRMPKNLATTVVIYAGVDGKPTQTAIIFLRKKSIDEDYHSLSIFANYFSLAKNLGAKSAPEQMAFGLAEAKDQFTSTEEAKARFFVPC